MRSTLLIPSLAVVLIGVAGCGSSSSSSSSSKTSASASTPATTTTSAGAKVKKALSKTYVLKMTGPAETPAGAPSGTAKAVVTLSTKTDKVCSTFKSSGVTHPTYAHIHIAPARKSGSIVVPLSTGSKFLTKGCVPASATVINAIAANPHGYYVNIHSQQYPSGAVRAQL